MQVAIIGANGKIGQQLTQLVQASDEHQSLAMVRKSAQQQEWQAQGVESRLIDLEGSVSELANAIQGAEAVVFTAGSGGSTGDDKTLLIDLDGAVKAMEAAQAVGAKRFIMVSAWQANTRENWAEQLLPYYAAKHYADRELMRSELDWTIVRPGALTDEPGSGQVQIDDELPAGSVPREDVAQVLLGCLNSRDMIGKAFDLTAK